MGTSQAGGGEAAAPQSGAGALDLNQLRTFLAVYRSGSFTAAARILGLSQPTVTAQIRSLERQLDRELFERLPRGAAPAPFADELASRIIEPLDALAEVAGHGSDGTADPVHLAGPAEFLSHCVLPGLAPLVERGVRLRITTGLTDDLLDELRTGRHDLVVATTRPRGRTLTWVPLADEEFVLVAAASWAERVGGAERLAELGPAALRGVPLVAYAEDVPIVRRYWRHVFGKRLVCEPAVTMPDLRAVKAAVAGGAGFSVLPRYLCLDELASGDLVLLNDPEDPPINTGYLVQRPGSSDNPHVAVVRDHLLASSRDC
ncbi:MULTISPECIES: LysR family transcriptional regulator [Streptomyces]|uniref:LysR family transcriptional regulator n=1 Tax=Streptomyces TaxID=1883 RepID=UPI001E4C69EA|nr:MULTISPECIES: LysR family transcriptional regulator [Streptomyces]UFQ19686.1 LysR family transcriptional regulator [Streptomyces huasconensis]WCL89305.1 LysR family transcriptional regulator [Streptomyces sp. JCM 35825]